MKRICPRCHIEMSTNCYVKDLAKSSLSYLQLIIQNDMFSKEKKEIKSCYCPQCGYIELFVDTQKQTVKKTNDDDSLQLLQTVEKYAKEHHQRLKSRQNSQNTSKK